MSASSYILVHSPDCPCGAHTGHLNDDGNIVYASIDPNAGGTYNDKPIWTLDQITENLNRTGDSWYVDAYSALAGDKILTYGFWSSYDELANSYYVSADGSIAFNEAYYAADFSVFNADQKMMAMKAFATWDDLINIKFEQSSASNADIAMGNTFTGGAQAYAYLPSLQDIDPLYQDLYGFEAAGRLGGDVWIDGFVASNFNPVIDSYYAQTTMIHELGHALGLSHPGTYNATDDNDGDGVADPITYENDAAFAQDTLQYSIMSYFDAYYTGAQFIDWNLLNFAYPATPMVHDIASIQEIYGADMTTRTGDTTYGFNSNAGRSAFDFTVNTRPVVAIWDAGGTDTLDFSGWNTASIINLNAGAFSSGGGIDDFLSLEQVNANRAALGFAPRTQATYQFYEDLKTSLGLTSGLFKDNVSIAYGVTIENAVGGGGDDLIVANQVANRIDGGAGSDTVSYETATGTVGVYLGTGTTNGRATGDVLISIENVTGSKFNDYLYGNDGNNTINGFGGADKMFAGRGIDTLSYANETAGVTVNLEFNDTGGAAADDSINGFENAIGGSGNDRLVGTDDANRLEGRSGDDTLRGARGNDTLLGGAGDDILVGGSGNDFFAYEADALGGRDTIQDFRRGQDKIDLSGLDAITGGTMDSFSFIGSNAFTAAGQVRAYVDNGVLTVAVNVDSDLGADMFITVQGGATTLTAADFQLTGMIA